MFKPMLATNTKIKQLRLPVLVSNKLEGVRGEFTPEGLRSRPMKKFNNRSLELFFADVSAYARANRITIEGEFYSHGLEFNEISSICRRANHPSTDLLQFHIFDVHDEDNHDRTFIERYEHICRIVSHIGKEHIVGIPQWQASSYPIIEEAYEEALEDGYEGLVFKAPMGIYKFGRSTHREGKFLRIKPDDTFDGIVLEIVERMENLVESKRNHLGYMSKTQDKNQKAHTGMAAVAITLCPDFPEPVRVVLSKNLTDQDRYEIWDQRTTYIGKHLRFFGIPVAGMDQPRCPRFDCWRTDLD